MLLRLGIEPTTPVDHPERYAELYRVARRLRDTGHHTVGLVPVGEHVGVPAAALQLGLALGDAAVKTVAFFDTNPQLPALTALEGNGAMIEGYAVIPLAPRLSAVTPRTAARPGGQEAPQIERALKETARRFDYVLADFTGLDRLGDHRWAYEIVDAVALVARAKVTREQDIVRLHREIPPERDLGVLIVG